MQTSYYVNPITGEPPHGTAVQGAFATGTVHKEPTETFREMWYMQAMERLKTNPSVPVSNEWLADMAALKGESDTGKGVMCTDGQSSSSCAEIQREWMQAHGHRYQRATPRSDAYYQRNFADPSQKFNDAADTPEGSYQSAHPNQIIQPGTDASSLGYRCASSVYGCNTHSPL